MEGRQFESTRANELCCRIPESAEGHLFCLGLPSSISEYEHEIPLADSWLDLVEHVPELLEAYPVVTIAISALECVEDPESKVSVTVTVTVMIMCTMLNTIVPAQTVDRLPAKPPELC